MARLLANDFSVRCRSPSGCRGRRRPSAAAPRPTTAPVPSARLTVDISSCSRPTRSGSSAAEMTARRGVARPPRRRRRGAGSRPRPNQVRPIRRSKSSDRRTAPTSPAGFRVVPHRSAHITDAGPAARRRATGPRRGVVTHRVADRWRGDRSVAGSTATRCQRLARCITAKVAPTGDDAPEVAAAGWLARPCRPGGRSPETHRVCRRSARRHVNRSSECTAAWSGSQARPAAPCCRTAGRPQAPISNRSTTGEATAREVGGRGATMIDDALHRDLRRARRARWSRNASTGSHARTHPGCGAVAL